MSADKQYQIEVQSQKNLILVRTFGVWSLEGTEQYNQELIKTIKQMNSPNGFVILYDTTHGSVLRPEVSAKIMEVVPQLEALGLKKTAIITTSAVIKMQANRLIQESNLADRTQHFSNEAEAISWLTQN